MAGRYEIRLSPEGRLKLRKPFTSRNDRVFLTKRVDDDGDWYLVGFSPKLWPRVAAEVCGQQGEGVKGFYLDDAREVEISADGTIVIPKPLRDFAQLKRCVTLLEMGLGDEEFWLWDPKAHDAALERMEKRIQKALLSTDF
jgi:DNA-binding transcriptional regulator/RsmH inhibitor MraZ